MPPIAPPPGPPAYFPNRAYFSFRAFPQAQSCMAANTRARLLFRPRHQTGYSGRPSLQLDLLPGAAVAGLGGVNVAARIDRHVVQRAEFARHAAGAAEAAEFPAVFAQQDIDLRIRSVGGEDKLLAPVARRHEIGDRAAQRLRVEKKLAHVSAVAEEHLDAVVRAVAYVHQAVTRAAHTMRIAELLRGLGAGLVCGHLVVARHLAVSAPMPFVRTRRRVEHDHAAVAVAIADENFVVGRLRIDRRRPAHMRIAVAALGSAGLADLQDEFAIAREFQKVIVRRIVAGSPHVALPVDVNAVLVLRPVIPLPGAAPGLLDVAVPVELDDRRRRLAAAVRRRLLLRTLVVVEQGGGTMQDPHVILAVDGHARDLAPDPVALERFWP